MNTPLIRVREKPRFALPWLSIILGIGTVVFAGVGVGTVTARPLAPVNIVVQGVHPLNISQSSVDAVIDEPILAGRPLTILVTDRQLSPDELQGHVSPGAGVILSTAIGDESADDGTDERFIGVDIHPADGNAEKNNANRLAIHNAYMDNVGIGHGPAAIAAAGQRAAQVLDDGPVRTPVFWLAGTTLGFSATILSFAYSLSRRRRRESLFRRLRAAQRQLASVVLGLEGLEATYRTTAQEKRTPGFTAAWNSIHDDSLALARTEDTVIEAVYDSTRALKPDTVDLVKEFETAARRLAFKADALMGAGSVLGRLAGSQRVLDRLAAPLVFSARELLARLESAEKAVVAPKRIHSLQGAVEVMLGILGKDTETAASIQGWEKAELELERCALAINRELRRHRQARVRAGAPQQEDFTSMRGSLGLSATGSRQTQYALDDTNAAARALFGPLPGSNETGSTAGAQHRWKPGNPYSAKRTLWIVGGVVLLLSSGMISAAVLGETSDGPGWSMTGTQSVQSLTLDGDTAGLSESGILSQLDDKFIPGANVTVAVRSAGDYMGLYPNPDLTQSNVVGAQDPQNLLGAMWRLKSEFPQKLNPSTGELQADQVIVPVWSLGNGMFSIPTILSGALTAGDDARLGDQSWETGKYRVAELGDSELANAIEDAARELQGNGLSTPQINDGLLFWLLTASITSALAALVLIVTYVGAISMKLGGIGRGAATLRRTRKELDSLAIGLDYSRLNTVTMLDAGSAGTHAESDQRIFERALAMASRMADDLAARPLSQRHGAVYVAQIEKLAGLVARLGIRNADAARRTSELLDTALRGNIYSGPHQ